MNNTQLNAALKEASPLNVEAVKRALELIQMAENSRRTGVGGPMLTKPTHPNKDYAIASIIISGAVHHLDESIPGRQEVRTKFALGALLLGTELLRQALAYQGIHPDGW